MRARITFRSASIDERRKVLFLTVMPSPYQRQLFMALAGDSATDIRVLYFVGSARDRSWRSPKLSEIERILPGCTLRFLGPSAHFNPGIIGELRRSEGSLVVVSDYSAVTAQLAMWFLTLTHRRWVFWGESPGMREGLFRRAVRSILMLPISIGASAVCAIGEEAAARYRVVLGPKKPIHNVPYFCDLAPFKAAQAARGERVTVLYSGQFIERKGLDVLIQAFAMASSVHPELELLLVGGTNSSSLLRAIPERLRSRVRVPGFVQPSNLPSIYAQADIFVLPSRYDGWGVVVNEALGSALPIIVSDRVGARELVKPGWNGYVFQSGNIDQLAECIVKLASSLELRQAFGRASAELAERFGLDEAVRRWNVVFGQTQERLSR